MIKLLRFPVKFQERGSGAWNDVLLTVGGGGTGASSASGARTNLGLGTMAVQDSSAVSISGGTLAGSGSGITSLNASNMASGTVPDARFPAILPAVSGQNLTTLNGSAISTGTIAPARLGSGSSITTKYLRGDSTWQTLALTSYRQYKLVQLTGISSLVSSHDFNMSDIGFSNVLATNKFKGQATFVSTGNQTGYAVALTTSTFRLYHPSESPEVIYSILLEYSEITSEL